MHAAKTEVCVLDAHLISIAYASEGKTSLVNESRFRSVRSDLCSSKCLFVQCLVALHELIPLTSVSVPA